MSGRSQLITTGGLYINKTPDLPARAEKDLYATPRAAVEQAYQFLLQREPTFRAHRAGSFNGNSVNSRPWRILDIGAGGGVWGQVAREIWPTAIILGVEERRVPRPAAYSGWFTADVREWHKTYRGEPFDLVASNPPYYCAEECVRIGMERLREGGFLMMLLELRFLVGQRRRDGLYTEYPLRYFGAYSRRISWTHDGKTPPRDHGLYLFEKGYTGPYQGYFLGQDPSPAHPAGR